MPLRRVQTLLFGLGSLAIISGCQSREAGTGQSGGIATDRVSGSVIAQEVGAASPRIYSAQLPDPSAVSDGSFSTVVSREGTQLLVLADRQDRVWALTLSLAPSVGSGSPPTVIPVGAESTALSSLFLVPGVLALEPGETEARIREIHACASFAGLVALLRQALPSAPLAEITDPNQNASLAQSYGNLVQAIIDELPSHRPQTATGELLLNTAVAPLKAADVEVYLAGAEPGDGIQSPYFWNVKLKNSGWRFVQIHRRTLGPDGLPTLPAYSEFTMGGATSLSIGSFFTRTAFDPAADQDVVDFVTSPTVQYWIDGPGFARSETGLPADLAHDDDLDTWGLTTILYVVFPIIDVVAGMHTVSGAQAYQIVKNVWKVIKNPVKARGSVDRLLSAAGPRQVAAALADLANTILDVLVLTGALKSWLSLTDSAEKLLKKFLSAPSIAFGAVNAAVVAYYFMSLPHVAKVVIRNIPPEVTIHSPFSGQVYANGEPVELTASAVDAEGVSITTEESFVWTSDRQGPIGTGRTITRTDLAAGSHSLRLAVADRHVARGFKTVAITVREPSGTGSDTCGCVPKYTRCSIITAPTNCQDPESGIWLCDPEKNFCCFQEFGAVCPDWSPPPPTEICYNHGWIMGNWDFVLRDPSQWGLDLWPTGGGATGEGHCGL